MGQPTARQIIHPVPVPAGAVAAGYTCNDWTTASSPSYGRNGEWDSRYLLKQETALCSTSLAVACVQIP